MGHFAQAGSKACLPCGQGTVSRKGAAYCSAPDLCTFTAVPSGSQYRLGALQHRWLPRHSLFACWLHS